MHDVDIIKELRSHMTNAKTRHPIWPKNSLEAAVNVAEEAGELLKEANNIKHLHITETELNYDCPLGRKFGIDFLYQNKDCYNCSSDHTCQRVQLYYRYKENMRREAFHTLTTIIRFIRNIEEY